MERRSSAFCSDSRVSGEGANALVGFAKVRKGGAHGGLVFTFWGGRAEPERYTAAPGNPLCYATFLTMKLLLVGAIAAGKTPSSTATET